MMDSYIEYIFILKNLFQNLFGMHYPIEIITSIILILYKPIQIVCGTDYTILFCDKTYVWGKNDHGQLGLGDTIDRNYPHKLPLHNLKLVSCGIYHTIALTLCDKIYVWGENDNGQLGLGDCIRIKIPTRMMSIPENRNELTKIKSIACGGFHTIVLTSDNKIYVWGYNGLGQLGLGDANYRNKPQKLMLDNVESISCGRLYTIALTRHNTLYVWGWNISGQLGLGDNITRCTPQKLSYFGDSPPDIKSINCGINYTIVLTSTNFLYAWGSNSEGQLGLGDNKNRNVPHKIELSNIKSVNCTRDHVVAIKTSERSVNPSNLLYVWGYNGTYQLGLGDNRDRTLPTELILKDIKIIKQIVCGGFHTIIITNIDEVYVWGANSHGQLGLGDHNGRISPCRLNFKF